MKWWKIVLLGLSSVGAAMGGLVAYAAATATSNLQFPDTPSPDLQASQDPELIERGRYLVHGPAHCAQCHSTDERTDPAAIRTTPLRGGLAFAMGPLGTRYARNLTPDANTGIGRLSDAELARTLRTGVLHDGELSFFMKLSASNLADEDIVAVVSYLRSLEPVANEVPRGEWYLLGKVLLTYAFPKLLPRPLKGPDYVAAAATPTLERGEYLAEHVAVCTACHTAIDLSTFEPVGPKAGGSLPDPSHGDDHDMEFVAPNLTSHPTGFTGKVSEDEFVARLRGGRMYTSSIMPWECFADTSETDLRAIYRYLRSLPPVDNDPGPTYRKRGWAPG
jgi:mono/diheme cytochrome c family protein